MAYIWLIIGFVLLIKGADFFVDGASSVAKLLRVPSVIIGLTVVAMGTSLPEASVSITAAISGRNDLALANVVGSNIFNLLVVAGASSLIHPIIVERGVIRRDLPYSIGITILLLLLCIRIPFLREEPLMFGRFDGILLLVLFVFYILITIRAALAARKNEEIFPQDVNPGRILPIWQTVLFIILGGAAIMIGGNLVVDNASVIAKTFGLSETLIGLTIVALGTSLPELVTSVVAAKKGESDLALGNVVGSNIFNILLILGASSALHPISIDRISVYDIVILLASSIVIYLFARTERKISRKEGGIMIAIYAAFFVFIVLR